MPKTEEGQKVEEQEVVDFSKLDLVKAMDELLIPGEEDTTNLDKLKLEDKDKDKEKTEEETEEEKKSSDTEEEEEEDPNKKSEEEEEDPDKKKEEEDPDKKSEEKNEEEDLSLISEVSQRLGLDSELEFTDSVDGLVDMTNEAASQLAETQLATLFNEYPDVQRYMQFRLQGGDENSFFKTFHPQEDYATLTLTEEDTQTQERLVRKSLTMLEREEEDITSTIEEFKTSGILHSQATQALKGLAKYQTREKETLLKQQNDVAAEESKNQEAYLDEVRTAIKGSSDFKGVIVSEKDKDSFFSYMANPVQNGQSQFNIDMAEAPVDVVLAIAALMRSKFDIDSLVMRKASSLKADDLRTRLKNTRTKLRSQSDESNKKLVPANIANLDLRL